MAKSKSETKVQISVGLEEPLREQLAAAARQSVRSLSAEIVFRLQRSFDRQPDAATA